MPRLAERPGVSAPRRLRVVYKHIPKMIAVGVMPCSAEKSAPRIRLREPPLRINAVHLFPWTRQHIETKIVEMSDRREIAVGVRR